MSYAHVTIRNPTKPKHFLCFRGCTTFIVNYYMTVAKGTNSCEPDTRPVDDL